MPAVRSVVIVGGGVSGLCLAIGLARAGIEVQVLEASDDGNVLGIGMALQAPALGALQTLGVLEHVVEAGFPHEVAAQLSRDGKLLSSQPVARPLGEDIPGQIGIQRRAFHRVLLDETLRLGVPVRFGTTITSVEQGPAGVVVTLGDGSTLTCDLVVGAEGAYSAMRRLLLACQLQPEYTGQVTWRVGVPRPAQVRGMTIVLGGPLSVGINPVTEEEAYIFVVQNVPARRHIPQPELLARLPELLSDYPGLIAELISGVRDASAVVYRPLESLTVPAPWYRGRAVLIGDAAHTTTPHMAAGALIAIQDAVVLADELARNTGVEPALANLMDRRYERCKLLVDACHQIGEWQKQGLVRNEAAGQLHARVMEVLARPL
jgi:2-polyprenyl-6-methoxyphenol hydroxylase-like FAD-dependent oxidoreductase